MHRTGSLNWLVEETQVQVLQLPYVNSTLGTIILLPVGTADVGQVRMLMSSEDAGVCAHAHDVCFVTIVLPVTDSIRFSSSARC